jgi:hypothetical protein
VFIIRDGVLGLTVQVLTQELSEWEATLENEHYLERNHYTKTKSHS